MTLKNEIVAGMLATRGDLMFLVLEVGIEYHDGYLLCRCIGTQMNKDHWILTSTLEPA